MPKYLIEMHDGRKFQVEADRPPTEAEVMAALGSTDAAPSAPAPAKPSAGQEARSQVADVGIGALKGLGSTLAGMGEMAFNTGALGIHPSGFRSPLFEKTDALTTATNTPQRVGKVGEQVAEWLVPGYQAGKAGLAFTGRIASKAGPMALEVASHTPYIGRGVRFARALAKLIPEEAPAASNAGGRLVKAAAKPTVENELAGVLDDLRKPSLPESVELPPARDLPAGYEPRVSAPDPKPPAPKPQMGRLVRSAPRRTLEEELAAALSNERGAPMSVELPPQPDLPPGYTPRSSAPAPKASAAPPKPAAAVEKPAVSSNAFVDVDAKGMSAKDVGRDWHAYGSEHERLMADNAERARMQGLHRDAGALDQRYRQLVHDPRAAMVPLPLVQGRDKKKPPAVEVNALQQLIAALMGS